MSLLTSLIPSLNREPSAPAAAESLQSVRPEYRVRESADAYTVQVFMPGVGKEALEVTADPSEIRVFGRRTWKKPQGWTTLYSEGADASYELVLTHSGDIEPNAITAELVDGVLTVSVPKAEAVKPRRIEIK